MVNEYGTELDRNGYAPSLLQTDHTKCYLCQRTDEKLDRHEIFYGSNRDKSKRLGLWVSICHSRCHIFGSNSVHKNAAVDFRLKQFGELAACNHFKWSTYNFIQAFGKNYI